MTSFNLAAFTASRAAQLARAHKQLTQADAGALVADAAKGLGRVPNASELKLMTSTLEKAKVTGAQPVALELKAAAVQQSLALLTQRANAGKGWIGTGVNPNPQSEKSGAPPLSAKEVQLGEQQIADLKPQLSRMYIDPRIITAYGGGKADPAAPELLGKLKHEVALAAKSGKVDLCLWSLPKGFHTSDAEMKDIAHRYSLLVKDLIGSTPGAKPSTFMVSSQNEPNRTKLSPKQIVTLNSAIDSQLTATLGPQVRKDVKLIAGDLTFNDDSAGWIKGVVKPLAGKVQGFSFHVYMHPGETPAQYEGRLRTLRSEVAAQLPKGTPMPALLVTEYGARGQRLATDPNDSPGHVREDGKLKTVRESRIGALHEGQILLSIARAGFSGGARWGVNPGGGTAWDSWSMTGTEAEKLKKMPAYHVTHLFTYGVAQGWQAQQPPPVQRAGETVASWKQPDGSTGATIIANANGGAELKTFGGFAPGAKLQLLSWNAHGGGGLTSQLVQADSAGNVKVPVGAGAISAVTTRLEVPQ